MCRIRKARLHAYVFEKCGVWKKLVWKMQTIQWVLDKLVGPTICLVFLKILIDVICKEASLSAEKPEELLAELQAWSYSKEIMSEAWITLPGWQTQLHLLHYSISASCIFLHYLIDWSTTARMPYHHITMSVEAHRDIPWWLKFLPTCNDCGLIGNTHWSDLWTLHRCICTLSYGFTMLVTVLLSPGLPY